MDAKIFYVLEYMSYGDTDERTGWYVQRIVVSKDQIIDRKPIMKFIEEYAVDRAFQVQEFDEYIKGKFPIVGRNQKVSDFIK